MSPPHKRARSDFPRASGAHPLPVRVYPLAAIFVWGSALALILAFWQHISFVLLLFLAAAAAAATLAPLRHRLPIPHWLGGVIVGTSAIVVAGGLFFLLGWSLSTPVQQQLRQWPEIRRNLDQSLSAISTQLGLATELNADQVVRQVFNWLTKGGGSALQTAVDSAGLIVVGVALVAFGMLYLLAERPERLLRPLQRLTPSHVDVPEAVGALGVRLRWWVIGTLISMLAAGALAGIGFFVIGLKFALPLALLAGIAEIVPTLGPVITFLIALLLATTQGTGVVVGVVAVYLGTQLLESYVLLPMVMREAVRVPPVVTLFTILLWGRLFGTLGLLLAIPINLTIWTAVEHLYLKASSRRHPEAEEDAAR